jgi:site-specific DNA recombinase
VPCSYIRDERLVTRGKRKRRTSGLRRPGRVRNMLINTTYKGLHEFGKRSKNPNRELIAREVPAIVTEVVWLKAQKTLKSNVLFSKRNASHQYLLRGLAKCGLCGLTYIGLATRRPSGKTDFYYRCNGKHGTRGIYGANGKRCPSKDVNGDFLEQSVWSDVEDFLRHPGTVIELLRQRMAAERAGSKRSRERLARLEDSLGGKITERDRILSLFRKGRISEKDLDNSWIRSARKKRPSGPTWRIWRQPSAVSGTKQPNCNRRRRCWRNCGAGSTKAFPGK